MGSDARYGYGTVFFARREEVLERLQVACGRAGRPVESIQLVAVSKMQPHLMVAGAYDQGQRIFGESRIQEALPKIAALALECPGIEWHLIGHLQRNKVNAIIDEQGPLFALIHSVDSVRLIEALETRAAQFGVTQRILLELNLAGEASKFGAPESEFENLLKALAAAPHLRGEGLMTIAPEADDPEIIRPVFKRLRELLTQTGPRTNFEPRELSMGMSHDMEAAIEEGATLVRVGTALFGERHTGI